MGSFKSGAAVKHLYLFVLAFIHFLYMHAASSFEGYTNLICESTQGQVVQ